MFSFGKTFDNYIKNLSNNETEKVLDLLDSSDKVFNDPLVLHYACYYKNYDVIKFLLSKKKSPLIEDFEGYIPLHYLTNMGELGELWKRKDIGYVNSDFGRTKQVFFDSFNLRILNLFKKHKSALNYLGHSANSICQSPIDISFDYLDINAIKGFFKLGVNLNQLNKRRKKITEKGIKEYIKEDDLWDVRELGKAPSNFSALEIYEEDLRVKYLEEGANLYFGILMDCSQEFDKRFWPTIKEIHTLLIKKRYKFNIKKSALYRMCETKKETDRLIHDYKGLLKNY